MFRFVVLPCFEPVTIHYNYTAKTIIIITYIVQSREVKGMTIIIVVIITIIIIIIIIIILIIIIIIIIIIITIMIIIIIKINTISASLLSMCPI